MTREEVLKIVSDAREKGERADLRWADLRWADLRWADLTGAKLTEADLTEADLAVAKLAMADLTGAKLTEAKLTGADLAGAKLTGADLRWADLRWTCLYGTTLPNRYIQVGPIGSRKDQIVYNADLDEIHTGCFRGTLDEFEAAVRENHKTNIHAREYLATARYLQEMREIQKTERES